ncbi:MAG TPA: helix-turn-helix domain-containing protein [Micromonosporaceae bacterium]
MGSREQTRRRILDGAASAFAKRGYAATSMEEIAATAGVSKLLLYRDFAGKRELYQAVLDRTKRRIEESVPPEATREALAALLTAARRDPDGFVLLFRHAAREPEFAGYAESISTEARQRCERLLRPYEPDPVLRRWAATVAIDATYQMIISWLEYGDPQRDQEILDRVASVSRAALSARTSRTEEVPR